MPNVDVPCGGPQCWLTLVFVTVTVQTVGLPRNTVLGLHVTEVLVLSGGNGVAVGVGVTVDVGVIVEVGVIVGVLVGVLDGV